MSRSHIKSPEATRGAKIGSPSSSASKPPEQCRPLFSFEHIQNGDFCITCCETSEKAALSDKLYRLSQLTWADIKQQHRHKLGFEKISRSSITAEIPPHITPDMDLIAFRFDGMKAMVGYRQLAVFHILWLDRTFKLYPHS
jgi:hypothetical protein